MAEATLVGLQSLAEALASCTHYRVSAVEAAYLVRQIHIGHGCVNGCSHCFANPPSTLEQMTSTSFRRLALEFAEAARRRREIFPFLFLGASSDPGMISEFAVYARSWITALPDWHPVRFYTHGWMLASNMQEREFNAFLTVLRDFPCRIGRLAFSVDMFSKFARDDWAGYLSNVARNLKAVSDILRPKALKLDVTYPPSRLSVASIYTIEYWRALAAGSAGFPSNDDVIRSLSHTSNGDESECSQLTTAIFTIGKRAGLSMRQTALICRDAGAAFPSGRARSFYAARPREDAEMALAGQRDHGLYALRGFRYGTTGIVLMPNGSARLVDYLGYRLGKWLRSGRVIIPYAESFIRNDHPWGAMQDGVQ